MWYIYPVFGVVIALLFGGTAVQALDASKTQAITRAADSFVALAKDAGKTGRAPRQTDPAVKPLLDVVFDTSELQSAGAFQMGDVANLNAWQVAVQRIGTVYLLAGTGLTSAELPTDPKAVDRINRNTTTFAPELGRYVDAELWIQVALIDTFRRFLETAPRSRIDDPKVRSGIAQVRTGLAQSVTGMVLMLDNQGLRDEWRRARLPAFWALGPLAAKFMLPEDVRTLRETVAAIANKTKDRASKSGLNLFASMLDTN